MTTEEAQIKQAIRTLYQNGFNKLSVEKTLKDCHNEVKIFFNVKE